MVLTAASTGTTYNVQELTSTLGDGGVSGALRKEDSKAETEDAFSVDVSEDEDGDYNAKEDFR